MANKKNKKKEIKKEEVVTSDVSLKNTIVLILCVIVVFMGFYLFTLNMTKDSKSNSSTEDTGEVEISDDTILLGQSLSVRDDDYYVLFYDFSDEDNSSKYYNLFLDYKNKENAMPIYRVDIGSGFNKKYVTEEESNKNPSTVEEFLINGITLMKISNHGVVQYVEGEEDITNTLS